MNAVTSAGTVGSPVVLATSVFAGRPRPTSGTVTFSGHVITYPVMHAETPVQAARAVRARRTIFFTASAAVSGRTHTDSTDGVTAGVILTRALLLAVLAPHAVRTRSVTQTAHVTWRACALASDVIAR